MVKSRVVYSSFVFFVTITINSCIQDQETCSKCDALNFHEFCGSSVCKSATNRTTDRPRVQLSIFIEQPIPFIKEFFEKLRLVEYGDAQMHLFLHNSFEAADSEMRNFTENYSSLFESVTVSESSSSDKNDERERKARTHAIKQCISVHCDFLFVLDGTVHVTNPNILSNLLRQQIQSGAPILASLLIRPDSAFSNFWGDVSDDGYYKRSTDYMQIAQYKKRGVFPAAFVNSAYLIAAEVLADLEQAFYYSNTDPDMSLCQYCRDEDIEMYVDNTEKFGYLIDPSDFDPSYTHAEMYEVINNPKDWEARYIHPDYWKAAAEGINVKEPCPDVYYWPMFTERFCWDMIDIMETYGKWSNGAHEDPRVGGYEGVPTRDIHFNQIDWDDQWIHILQKYIRPVQEKMYEGFEEKKMVALTNFVVRYRPDEQPALKPHSDISTYTVNFALNRGNGTDYSGGGSRFIRYDCAVRNQAQGWGLMHPGRFTHYHEGLKTTNGTRYILVSFVHP